VVDIARQTESPLPSKYDPSHFVAAVTSVAVATSAIAPWVRSRTRQLSTVRSRLSYASLSRALAGDSQQSDRPLVAARSLSSIRRDMRADIRRNFPFQTIPGPVVAVSAPPRRAGPRRGLEGDPGLGTRPRAGESSRASRLGCPAGARPAASAIGGLGSLRGRFAVGGWGSAGRQPASA